MTGGVEKRCGCPEARWPKCPHPSWYLKEFAHQRRVYAPNLTKHARVVLNKTITTKTEAEAVAGLVRTAIQTGTYVAAKDYRPPTAAPAQGQLLDQVATRYRELRIDANAKKKANSKTNDRAILKRLCAAPYQQSKRRLGTVPIAQITIDDLVAFRGTLDGLANSTWAKYRTLLGQLFRWAKWSGHTDTDIVAAAPPDVLDLLGREKAKQRRRRIDDEELENLKEAAREIRADHSVRLVALIIAAFETGARIGELLALQWRDVDLFTRNIHIRAEEIGASKSGRSRDVEISQPLYDIMVTLTCDPAGQQFPRTAYVFGSPYGERIKSIDKAFGTTVLRANNIEPAWTAGGDFDQDTRAELQRIDLHFHDIRHEAACRWHESHAFELSEIQLRLGHATLAQTSTYVHANPGSTRRAQQQYDAMRAAAAKAAGKKRAAAASVQYKASTNRQSRDSRRAQPRVANRSKS